MSVKTLSKNSLRKIRLKGLFLSFVIIISVFSNFHSLNYNFFRIFYINPITDFKSYYSEEVMLSNHSDMIPIDLKELNIVDLYTWRESLLNADENLNGINDQFELKLDKFKDSTITTSSEIENKKYIAPDEILKDLSGSINQLESNTLSSEELSIIIQFPECNYEPISSLFEDLGGIIHFEYKSALNGFAGKVDYNAFNDFISILNKNEIPFFIEEDLECKTELYYSSRNMNLRPYVWKNLTNTGDRYSSIAILDTGIDDTHPLFSPGYSDGDFTSKIVGWNDQVNGISAPYDDHGHGSHCSGIAAGNGNLSLDTNGRTVATHGLNIDYRGSYVDPQILETIASRFQVTDPGIVEIECLYNDLTPGVDNVELHVFLYHDEVIVDEFTTSASSWTHTLSYIVTSGDLGDYSLRYAINFIDGDSDDYCRYPYFGIRGVIHWPFNPELFDINEPFKGVAPDAKLVGVKVMDEKGSGLTSCLLAGINWVVYNKIKYNITTISMSLGYDSDGETSVINAVNNAVDQGIVVVTSAGNRGPEGNHIGSPGDADKVITVAAMGNDDRVTSYSSQGSSNKPDIMAPGGSRLSGTFFSADSNDYDAGIQFADGYPDDLASMQGTSMACPAVAGAVNLLIEAMGGHQNWNYTAIEVLRIKALLLMSATETYPLMRELSTEQYSPLLNRGGRDAHEGYGRMNVDIALETITQNLDINSEKSMIISSSVIDPFEKHGFGCNLDLIKGVNYKLKLNVPDGVDFDLHLYSSSPNDIGLPIMVASSISSALGEDEIIDFIPTTTGKYYLIVKAIYGSGNASVSFLPNEFAPSLTNEKLTPHSEFQNHIFNFSITYNDADNFHPAYINVVVNGTPHAMQKVDPLDNNYEDGCVFQYLTYFQPALHNYTYYFECSDGAFIDTTSIHNDLEVNEINNLAPLLSEGHVSPQIGYNGSTLFTFFVNYTDQDNNMPTSVNLILNSVKYDMKKQDPLDDCYIDGCIYSYSTQIDDIGISSYFFNCSDGVFINTSVTYTNLNVSERPIVIETNPRNYDMKVGYHYNWIDTSDGIGFSVLEIGYSSYDLPFNFTFYNKTFSTVHVSGKGYISFTDSSPILIEDYISIPNGDPSYHYMIAPLLGDFNTYILDGAMVYVKSFETYWVAEWINAISPKFDGNFQVVLFESGDIVFNYHDLNGIKEFFLSGLNLGLDTNYYNSYTFPDSYVYHTSILFNYTKNENEPILSSISVDPYVGDQSTLYNFSVIYTDIDNDAPSYVHLMINDSTYIMHKENPLDVDYTDGCKFIFSTRLFPSPFNYSYSIECAERIHKSSSNTYNDLQVNLVNNYAPELVYPQISSLFEGNDVFVRFTVDYVDIDNNLPFFVNITINDNSYEMCPIDPLDLYSIDGIKYYLEISLDYGQYNYEINCSDGYFLNSTGVFSGLEINPFYWLYRNYTIFKDDFEDGTVGSDWNITGMGGISDSTSNSGSYSAFLSGGPGSFTSRNISLSNFINVTLSWWIRGGNYPFSDPPSIHEDLFVEYYNEAGDWIQIKHYYGSKASGKIYIVNNLILPEDALHSDFKLRFRQSLGFEGYSYWHFDDVLLSGKGYLDMVHPKNSNIVYKGTGNTNFEWKSLELPLGAINYTLQISNTSDFSSIFLEVNDIIEMPGSTVVSILLDLPLFKTGDYYWRVCPIFNDLIGNWTEYFTFNLIFNDHAPSVCNGSVAPKIGNTNTLYLFTVNYTDADNNEPSYIYLNINALNYSINKLDSLDVDYTDGCIYYFSTNLPQSPTNYTYYFVCSDGRFSNISEIYSNLKVNEVNLNKPILMNPRASPLNGTNNTIFRFTVDFFDIDNNQPLFVNISINGLTFSMVRSNPLDNNSFDGIEYYFETILNYGQCFFEINCSDGLNLNSTGVIPGPEVNPFFNPSAMGILFKDDFENGTLGSNWILSGEGGVNNATSNSGFYSAYLSNESASITSQIFDLSTYQEVNISFWIRIGSNDFSVFPEYGELFIQYYDENLGYFRILYSIRGDEVPGEIFLINNLRLPSNALHSNSRIRFYLAPGITDGQGTFHIDDVILTAKPNPIIHPSNGENIYSGLTEFTWKSLELPSVGVNYTLQISNTSDFSNINLEIIDIQETPNITVILLDLNLQTDRYYWRVRPTYDMFTGPWSLTSAFDFISNNNAPLLIDETITPKNANQHSTILFTVIYVDQDNNMPIEVYVTINGSNYSMIKQDLWDNDYTDGCLYIYTTSLNPASFNYTYSFSCFDGRFTNSTEAFTDLKVTEVNWNDPELVNSRVTPSVGQNYTLFRFIVVYVDADNNLPLYVNISINGMIFEMIQSNPLDKNALDGIGFYYETLLEFGFHNFEINCSDGLRINSTGLITGPEVNPFFGFSRDFIIFEDDFEDGSLGSDWEYSRPPFSMGEGGVSTITSNSGVYSAYLSSGEGYIYSRNIDLSSYQFVNLSFWVRRGGYPYGEIPDINEDLIVEYYNKLNNWIQIAYYPGGIDGGQIFKVFNYILPSDALHPSFKIRFRQTDGYLRFEDYWFFDDVILTGSSLPILIKPYNNITIFSGMTNFTWENLKTPLNIANYTFQLSNVSDFSNINLEINDIQETPNITAILLDLNLQTDRYYWRVRPTYGIFTGPWSLISTFDFISNNYVPLLIDETVTPKNANQHSTILFTVMYVDQDNNRPIEIYVTINGSNYTMVKQDIWDNDYTDGCLYTYAISLAAAVFNYSYSFNCFDGRFTSSTDTFTDLNVTEVNWNDPELVNSRVTPSVGQNDTLFRFMVDYIDADNNFPLYVNISINGMIFEMIQSNPLDNNALDGIEFYYETILVYGFYDFEINCSDGLHINSTGLLSGPEVNPFFGLGKDFIIFEEDFEDGILDTDWSLTGVGGVSSATSNSGSYSAYHSEGPGSITSRIIDLSPYSFVNLSFWLRRGGSPYGEIPDINEDLFVEYYTYAGIWSQIKQYYGGGTPRQIYTVNDLILPENALHSNFQIRFRQASGSGTNLDYWYIDDVILKTLSYIKVINPENGIKLYKGIMNFTWNSLNLSLGAVNFTLEISNISDYSYINYEIVGINEMISTTNVLINLNFPDNQYYWRLRPTYNNLLGGWSYFNFYIEPNDFMPLLINGSVNPKLGNSRTQFNFTVIYIDYDNNAPIYVNLIIDGSIFSMNKINILDILYSDGCIYFIELYLTPKIENYTYHFECYDGLFSNITFEYSDLKVISDHSEPDNPIEGPDYLFFMVIGLTLGSVSLISISAVIVYIIWKKKLNLKKLNKITKKIEGSNL